MSLLYDMDAIKGYLLAKKNGFTQELFLETYGEITREESERLAKAKEGTSLVANIAGTLSGYITEPETLIDFASPGKIIGSTIAKGAAKAFVTEAAYAGVSEVMRQKKIRQHMERAGLEYTLWDSTKEVLINSGFAGTLRGIGSAVMDWRVVSKINNGITNATDKEIFDRFARRENFKLTQNSNKHLRLMEQTEADIEAGKNTEVSAHTDIDINTRTDDAVEANDFRQRLGEDYVAKGYDAEEKALNDTIEADPIPDDVYGGMATNEDGDALIREYATHPEIEAELRELDELELRMKSAQESPRFEEAIEGARERSFKDTRSPTRIVTKGTLVRDEARFGGEDLTTRLAPITEKNHNYDFSLTKQDIANFEKGNITDELLAKIEDDLAVLENDPTYQLIQEAVDDGVELRPDGNLYDIDGNKLFAKGLDNLVAGGVAGVEVDEEGNITLDPAKFVLGMAGLSVAKRIANMNTVQEAFKGYVGRQLEKFEQTRVGQAVTGLQKIVPDDNSIHEQGYDPKGDN